MRQKGCGYGRHRLRASQHDRSRPLNSGSRLAGGRIDVIRAEKRSGTTTQGRDELRTILDFLHDGDVLMVTRIDRLARSIADLQDIVRQVRAGRLVEGDGTAD